MVLSWLITEKDQRSCRGSDWGAGRWHNAIHWEGKTATTNKTKRERLWRWRPRLFVHVELWRSRLMRGPLALSVAQRPPWGGRGFRGSHIAGGNCPRRTRGDHPGCRVGEEDVGGRGSQGNSSREQGTEEKESGKRSPGSEKEMGCWGRLGNKEMKLLPMLPREPVHFPWM